MSNDHRTINPKIPPLSPDDTIIDLVLYGSCPTSITDVFVEGRRLLPSEYELTEDGRVRLLNPAGSSDK